MIDTGDCQSQLFMTEFLLILCDTWDDLTRPTCHDISLMDANSPLGCTTCKVQSKALDNTAKTTAKHLILQ